MFKLESLWSLLFPKRPDAALIETLTVDFLSTNQRPLQTAEATILLDFQKPIVRACIHELKYHRNPQALKLLAQVLRVYLEGKTEPYIIIPIPLSAARRKKRKYNQSALLATESCHSLPHCTVRPELLMRTRDTEPQTTLGKTARLANMKGAFAVPERKQAAIHQARIIILDDVLTTGATLRAAKAALLPYSPASVSLLALAH